MRSFFGFSLVEQAGVLSVAQAHSASCNLSYFVLDTKNILILEKEQTEAAIINHLPIQDNSLEEYGIVIREAIEVNNRS